MTRLEQEVLNAAWRRWERGEVTERSPSPRIGDALKMERGIALGEETDHLLAAYDPQPEKKVQHEGDRDASDIVIKRRAFTVFLLMIEQDRKSAILNKIHTGIPIEEAIDEVCGTGTAASIISESREDSAEDEEVADNTEIIYDGDVVDHATLGQLFHSAASISMIINGKREDIQAIGIFSAAFGYGDTHCLEERKEGDQALARALCAGDTKWNVALTFFRDGDSYKQIVHIISNDSDSDRLIIPVFNPDAFHWNEDRQEYGLRP